MYNKENKLNSICLITPGHLSTNPRLMKEVEALLEAGFKVHVIFTQYMHYLLKDDDLLLLKHPGLTHDALRWVNKTNLNRVLWGVIQKISKIFAKISRNNSLIHKFVLNRHYLWQYRKAVKIKADIYIAHNSGALAVAADAAKKNNVPFGFDAEDFHRGENLSETERNSLIHLENCYIPRATYLTAASELIAEAYRQIYQKNFTTILNVFPKQKLNNIEYLKSRRLQLFWFSQTIGEGRGIENIIDAMSLLDDKSSVLHLLGDISVSMKLKLEKLLLKKGLAPENLLFYAPIFPDHIFEFAHNFDIGIASEIKTPLNRDICLTNKIFTYIQSGLAVIASDTSAQAKLLQDFPKIGALYQNDDIQSLVEILKNYQLFPQHLSRAKQYCSSLGNTQFNWEIEKVKFINVLNNIS